MRPYERSHQSTLARTATVAVGLISIAAVSAFGFAGIAHAAGGVTADDSRATVVQGNINSCPAGETLLVDGSTSTTTQNGITVTVSHLATSQPNPFPAGGVTTLPAGTPILTVSLPSGTQLIGHTYVKGGDGYNAYPGTALTGLIPPVTNGGQIAGLSHFFVCGTLAPTTGEISVKKVVTGTGPGSSGTFSVEVDCGAGHDVTLTLSDGQTKTVDNIPDGSSCTVTETSTGGSTSQTYQVNSGGTTSTPPTFVVNAGDSDNVTVTNDYAPGSLKVTKHVSGVLPGGVSTFPIDVDCAGTVTHFDLADGQSGTVSPIPGGTQCTVTETDSHGAVASYTVNAGGSSNSPPTTTIVNGTETDVDVTNTYVAAPPQSGSVSVTKTVTGTPPTGLGSFPFTLDCGGVVTPLSLSDGQTVPTTGIAAGTQCTLTENNNKNASSTTFSINGGPAVSSATFTIVANQITTVDVVNQYAPASLSVTKAVAGSNPSSGPFLVDADCGSAGDFQFSINAGDTHVVSNNLPGGTQCTVTETDAGGAHATTYQVNAGTPGSTPPTVTLGVGGSKTVTITNTFVAVAPGGSGALHLTKAVNKHSANYGDNLTYTLHVSASGQITEHNVQVTDVVPAKTTFVSADCPSPCTASGPSSGGVVTWDIGDMTPGSSMNLTMVVNITTPPEPSTVPQREHIHNVAVASSDQHQVKSNRVSTVVTQVIGKAVHRHPTSSGQTLPFTGVESEQMGLLALLLIGVGTAMSIAGRRRNVAALANGRIKTSVIDRQHKGRHRR